MKKNRCILQDRKFRCWAPMDRMGICKHCLRFVPGICHYYTMGSCESKEAQSEALESEIEWCRGELRKRNALPPFQIKHEGAQ